MSSVKPSNSVVAVLHWGFSIGGIAQYSTIIDLVDEYTDVKLHNIVVLQPGAHVDENTLKMLKSVKVIQSGSRLGVSVFRDIKNEIVNSSPILVMTHGFNAHFIMILLRFFYGLKIQAVCSYHGLYHATTQARKFFGLFYNKLTEFYIKHCVVSAVVVAEHCRRYLIGRGVPDKKIRMIHNGIAEITESDSKKVSIIRDEWDVAENEILLGVASRLDPVKGVGYLIKAFVDICNTHDNVKLVLIGTGTLERELQELSVKQGIEDRVVFAGFRSDVQDCLYAIDIFMLPSLAEYHSIGLLEAMRAGKAIICTNVGGNTESVRDGIEAVVIPPADTETIRQAVVKLLDDRSLRDKYGLAARQRFLEKFTIDGTVKKTADWFRDCIATAG